VEIGRGLTLSLHSVRSFIWRWTLALIGGLGLRSRSEDVRFDAASEVSVGADGRYCVRKPDSFLEARLDLAPSWFTTPRTNSAGGVPVHWTFYIQDWRPRCNFNTALMSLECAFPNSICFSKNPVLPLQRTDNVPRTW
jgi:hypothetical protein